MLVGEITLLAYTQHVIDQTHLQIYVNRPEPHLAEVPEDYYCIGSDCQVGQDCYLWASDSSRDLYLVVPGVGIFAASWLTLGDADDVLRYHPALGVVARA